MNLDIWKKLETRLRGSEVEQVEDVTVLTFRWAYIWSSRFLSVSGGQLSRITALTIFLKFGSPTPALAVLDCSIYLIKPVTIGDRALVVCYILSLGVHARLCHSRRKDLNGLKVIFLSQNVDIQFGWFRFLIHVHVLSCFRLLSSSSSLKR